MVLKLLNNIHFVYNVFVCRPTQFVCFFSCNKFYNSDDLFFLYIYFVGGRHMLLDCLFFALLVEFHGGKVLIRVSFHGDKILWLGLFDDNGTLKVLITRN